MFTKMFHLWPVVAFIISVMLIALLLINGVELPKVAQ